jgi:hypothetical protein
MQTDYKLQLEISTIRRLPLLDQCDGFAREKMGKV